jgi:hypothetical protein
MTVLHGVSEINRACNVTCGTAVTFMYAITCDSIFPHIVPKFWKLHKNISVYIFATLKRDKGVTFL